MQSSRPGLRAFAALALTVGLAACANPPSTTTLQPVDQGAAPTTGTTTGAAPATGAQEPAAPVQQPAAGAQEPTSGVQEPSTGGGGGTTATPAPTAAPTAAPTPVATGLPTPRPTPTPEPTPDVTREEDEPNDTPAQAMALDDDDVGVGEIDTDGPDLWAVDAEGARLWITLGGADDRPFAGDLIVLDETGFQLYRDPITAGEAAVETLLDDIRLDRGETYYIGFDRTTREGRRKYTIHVRTSD